MGQLLQTRLIVATTMINVGSVKENALKNMRANFFLITGY